MSRNRFAAALFVWLLSGAVGAQSAPEATPTPLTGMVPLVRVTPEYPREAARDGISGYVEFEVTVNPDGTVKKARVTKAEPRGAFEVSATRALMRWRFQPRVVDGKAIEYTGTQRIDYYVESEDLIRKREACEAAREPKRPRATLSRQFASGAGKLVAMLKASKYAEADALARELLEKEPTPIERAITQQLRGGALSGLDRRDEAIAAYEAALATQALPWIADDQVRFNVIQLHAGAGRREQARHLLEQYLKDSCSPSPQAREQLERLAAPEPKP